MLILKTMDETQIRHLHRFQMHRDFPPSELKTLDAILSLMRAGVYDALGAYQDGQLVGYALMFRPAGERIALLDYLAIEPQMRGRGVGTELLACLQKHYAESLAALMIECERPKAAPDEAEARARIRFYTQAGAQMTSVRIWLFAVEYSILVLPCAQAVPDTDWAKQMLSLYRQMLPEELYERNVRLLRA